MSPRVDLEARFARAADLLLGELRADETLSMEFAGEDSLHMRFNEGRVRQIGSVEKSELSFSYRRGGRTLHSSFAVSGDPSTDEARAAAALGSARREAALLPPDPFQTQPAAAGSSREVFPGRLPDAASAPEAVLGPGAELGKAGASFVGLHTQGTVARGAANSKGARHWFQTETFITDYSAYLPNGKAVKSAHSGRDWDQAAYAARIAAELPRLEALGREPRTVPPGRYRAWIAPDALAEFAVFFSWNGVGERSLREGESSWMALREGRRTLSPRFRLVQDFSLGVQPRFNELGEVAPERLAVIEGGRLANSLVSARSSGQYGVPSNAAPESEELRSPALDPGELDEARALEALGTGLYLSNLHYLNWSDSESARVTGMTRFACFWVEEGRIVAPIKDLRFDESLYHLFGDRLEGLSRQRSLVVDNGSYFQRSLGGSLLPALLVDGLTFTL